MANETVFSNYETVAAFLDTAIAPNFRSANVMMNLMHIVNFSKDSDSVKLRKAGSLTATGATEATDHATSQYDQSSPNTLTAAEIKVYVELSDKALLFTQASLDELAVEAGRACAAKFDTDALALLDSLNGGTQIGTSGADCSPQILLQAAYTVNAQNIPGPFVYVLHPVQIYDVQDDLITTGGVVWSNPTKLDILSGQPPASNGYRGKFLDIDVFQSTNTESVNTNADWAGGCFSPSLALAAGVFGGVRSRVGYNVKKGVTELGVSMWYDVKEYQDLAGVSIETGK